MLHLKSLLAAALLGQTSWAQVVGTPSGHAAGTTGGGDPTPVAPADLDELIAWLGDDEPRVVLIDREFDFIGSEGTTTETGCIPDSNTCGSSGQNAINGPDWCSGSDWQQGKTEVTYDNAASEWLYVKSDKTIIGLGDAGVIRGKGLYLSDVSNVIIQNIHITELNPQYIWGGDALNIGGSTNVWIDHVTFSLVGRQMIVTHFDPSTKVTISNCDFNGNTDWSSSCDGHHYWTVMFAGEGDEITFANNYLRMTSGRAPKAGQGYLHAVNNYWEDNSGHAFDVMADANVLMEGNVFSNVNAPLMDEPVGKLFNAMDDVEACSATFGRRCYTNEITGGSGSMAAYTDDVFSAYGDGYNWEAMDQTLVADYVSENAGVGKI